MIKVVNRFHGGKMSQSEINDMYTNPLDQTCSDIFSNLGYDPQFVMTLPEYCSCYDVTVLENIIDNMCKAIIKEVRKLPHSKFHKFLKPYWDDGLNNLSKNKKTK